MMGCLPACVCDYARDMCALGARFPSFHDIIVFRLTLMQIGNGVEWASKRISLSGAGCPRVGVLLGRRLRHA